MKPVDQQFMHNPAKGTVGDCFRACIASVLELPADAVPHFALLGNRWSRVADAFCEALSRDLEWHDGEPPDDIWAIVTVQSPRGSDVRHSVIYRGGKMVHDPHPSRAGGEPIGGYFCLTPDLPSPHTAMTRVRTAPEKGY